MKISMLGRRLGSYRLRKKLGRNNPCWCGSGKKFKKCHLGRDNQEPQKLSETFKEFKKAFSVKDCLVPTQLKGGCSGRIIRAHTVPKSSSLGHIARNGHVYSINPSLENLYKHRGRLMPELVGINKASTFTGFCSVHDNDLFKSLEDRPFTGSQEQCFLLGYRATARELFTKKAAKFLQPTLKQADQGKSVNDQVSIQAFATSVDTGVSSGLKNIEYHKNIYDQTLLGQDFRDVRGYIIELDSPPPVMCSGGTFPEQDFNGNVLQDIGNLGRTPHLLSFTSFHGGRNGVVVFTWLPGSHDICRKFVNSLISMSSSQITGALLRFFFEFCENLHIRPDWWDSLPESKQAALMARMTDSADPNLPRRMGCLTDDGISFQEWNIVSTRAVGFC